MATKALASRELPDNKVADTVIDEGDRGGASDGLESDAEGNIYSTNYEHNAILRRKNKEWETIVHDPRLLWPDTLSLATNGYLYVTAISYIAKQDTITDKIYDLSHMSSFESKLMQGRFY